MIFAIDIGNSNIVIGVMDERKAIRFSGRIPTNRKMSQEEFMLELEELLEPEKVLLGEINGTIISSVVPEVTEQVKAAMEEMTGRRAIVVGPAVKTGITIAMDTPSKVGADLVVDAVAAVEEYTGPYAIFDMGTATTCSVVSADKIYLGTLIMPGVRISQDALTERTSQLPKICIEVPQRLIGKNTVESMQSGLIYGNAAMVDGLIDRVEETIGEKVTAIATGGIAGLIVPHCRRRVVYDPDLLLKGLWHIYFSNI